MSKQPCADQQFLAAELDKLPSVIMNGYSFLFKWKAIENPYVSVEVRQVLRKDCRASSFKKLKQKDSLPFLLTLMGSPEVASLPYLPVKIPYVLGLFMPFIGTDHLVTLIPILISRQGMICKGIMDLVFIYLFLNESKRKTH